jgi:hypothetical protein
MRKAVRLTVVVATALMLADVVHAQSQPFSPQRTTMINARAVAMAWEAFAVDNNSYTPHDPKSGITSMGRGSSTELRWSNYVQLSFDYLRGMLEPTYIKSLPQTDGWGYPLQFAVHLTSGASDQYVIRSLGSDGAADGDGTYSPGATGLQTADIVFSDGEFVTYPKGINIGRTARPIAELNELKPIEHVMALLEASGYRYAKVSESMWTFTFEAKSVESLEVHVYLIDYLLTAFVYVGGKETLKLDSSTMRTMLLYNDDVDAAKVVLEDDGKVIYRIDAPLRVVDEEQFRFMLTQATKGADELIAKLLPKSHGPTS